MQIQSRTALLQTVPSHEPEICGEHEQIFQHHSVSNFRDTGQTQRNSPTYLTLALKNISWTEILTRFLTMSCDTVCGRQRVGPNAGLRSRAELKIQVYCWTYRKPDTESVN